MGLLDGFEKLINEHGSAVILKERIALADEKYAILEKKVSVLEAENNRLKLDNEESHKQRRALEEKLSQNNNPLRFDEKTGTLINAVDNLRYCAKCTANNKSSPLKNGSYGWECPVCNSKFPDPTRPRPIGISVARR
jgi:DNA repair exonuclease SbcCD ATPase subunit